MMNIHAFVDNEESTVYVKNNDNEYFLKFLKTTMMNISFLTICTQRTPKGPK